MGYNREIFLYWGHGNLEKFSIFIRNRLQLDEYHLFNLEIKIPKLSIPNGKKGDKKLNIEEIFTTKNLILYLIAINLFGFFIMWLDKRKAKKGAWRIPEKTLIIITALRRRYWNYSRNVYF